VNIVRLQRVIPESGTFSYYELEVDTDHQDLFATASVTRRYGRIGEPLQEKVSYFESEAAASAFVQSKVSERMDQGYELVEGENELRVESCFFCRLLQDPESDPCYVASFSSSTLIVGWDQTYRGRSILVLNKHLPDFFRVSHQEMLRLLSDIKKAEAMLRHAFSPEMMNYLFMGNVTQHAHLHLVPRYSSDPNFGSSPFLDTTRVRTPSLAPDEYASLARQVRSAGQS